MDEVEKHKWWKADDQFTAKYTQRNRDAQELIKPGAAERRERRDQALFLGRDCRESQSSTAF